MINTCCQQWSSQNGFVSYYLVTRPTRSSLNNSFSGTLKKPDKPWCHRCDGEWWHGKLQWDGQRHAWRPQQRSEAATEAQLSGEGIGHRVLHGCVRGVGGRVGGPGARSQGNLPQGGHLWRVRAPGRGHWLYRRLPRQQQDAASPPHLGDFLARRTHSENKRWPDNLKIKERLNALIHLLGKDESRSPVRGGGRGSITAPTSRKTSAVRNIHLNLSGSSQLLS